MDPLLRSISFALNPHGSQKESQGESQSESQKFNFGDISTDINQTSTQSSHKSSDQSSAQTSKQSSSQSSSQSSPWLSINDIFSKPFQFVSGNTQTLSKTGGKSFSKTSHKQAVKKHTKSSHEHHETFLDANVGIGNTVNNESNSFIDVSVDDKDISLTAQTFQKICNSVGQTMTEINNGAFDSKQEGNQTIEVGDITASGEAQFSVLQQGTSKNNVVNERVSQIIMEANLNAGQQLLLAQSLDFTFDDNDEIVSKVKNESTSTSTGDPKPEGDVCPEGGSFLSVNACVNNVVNNLSNVDYSSAMSHLNYVNNNDKHINTEVVNETVNRFINNFSATYNASINQAMKIGNVNLQDKAKVELKQLLDFTNDIKNKLDTYIKNKSTQSTNQSSEITDTNASHISDSDKVVHENETVRKKTSISKGAIIAIVITVVAIVAIVIGFLIWYYKFKRTEHNNGFLPTTPTPSAPIPVNPTVHPQMQSTRPFVNSDLTAHQPETNEEHANGSNEQPSQEPNEEHTEEPNEEPNEEQPTYNTIRYDTVTSEEFREQHSQEHNEEPPKEDNEKPANANEQNSQEHKVSEFSLPPDMEPPESSQEMTGGCSHKSLQDLSNDYDALMKSIENCTDNNDRLRKYVQLGMICEDALETIKKCDSGDYKKWEDRKNNAFASEHELRMKLV